MQKRISLALVFIIISIVLVGFGAKPTKVVSLANSSSGDIYFSEKDYTDSDTLLKSDGETSKTILDFAKEVKAGTIGTYYPELSEVIPRQYLESQEENATFAYNGKEYGFYVVKSNDLYHVLLIDFVYEFSEDDTIHTSDLEYLMKIKPIMQECFRRVLRSDNTYTWRKVAKNRFYYVANPRFVSVLRNENALNYGEKGYDKMSDEGLIINQFRMNYGKVCYSTMADVEDCYDEVMTNLLFDFVCGIVDVCTGGVAGSIASIVNDTINGIHDLYEIGKETVVIVGNEKNIRTGLSRTMQRENPKIPGYSRTVGFTAQEEVVLSDDDQSYVEFITVLNDTNYRSRLTQICEFDIMARDHQYDDMELVSENALTFRERVLFDDKSVTELNADKTEQENKVYLLANGNQKFNYECKESGMYRITTDTSAPAITVWYNKTQIPVTNDSGSATEFYLEKGKKYDIVFSGSEATQYNFKFAKKVRSAAFGVCALPDMKNEECVRYCFSSGENKYVKIKFDEEKYDLIVTKDNGEGNINFLSTSGVTDQRVFFAVAGVPYELRFRNKAGKMIDAETFTIEDISEIEKEDVGEKFIVDSEHQQCKVTNLYNTTMDYCLTVTSTGNKTVTAQVLNLLGSVIATVSGGSGQKKYRFSLGRGESCNILFSDGSGVAEAVLTYEEDQFVWSVNGEKIGSSVTVPRGRSYQIGLKKKDGSVIEGLGDLNIGVSDWCEIEDDKIIVAKNATIGQNVHVYFSGLPSENLYLIFGYNNELNYWVENGEKVFLKYAPNNSETVKGLDVTTTVMLKRSNTDTKGVTYMLAGTTGSLDITSFLLTVMAENGNKESVFKVFFMSVEVGSFSYENNTSYFLENPISVSTLFANVANQYQIHRINCKRHLQNLHYSDTTAAYELKADIDFGGSVWEPIPTWSGTLAGNGHVIKNMKFEKTATAGTGTINYGMFSVISGVSGIMDLTLKNPIGGNLYFERDVNFGLFAGKLLEGSALVNCHVEGANVNVKSGVHEVFAGGVVGYVIQGSLGQCSFSGSISVTNKERCEVGGLIGRNTSGKIGQCYTTGSVRVESSGTSIKLNVGGLIGRSTHNTNYDELPLIVNCYSRSTVFADATDSDCYTIAGGLVGVLKQSSVQYCYATGTVTAKSNYSKAYAGGFAGEVTDCADGGYVKNVFATGNVYARGNYSGAERKYSMFGRFCGTESNNVFLKIYYNKDSEFKEALTGTETKWNTSWYTGKTVSELKTASFQKNELGLSTSVWNISDNAYPTLK